MLSSVRTFSLRRLDDSPDRPVIVSRHTEYHTGLAAECRTQVTGPEQGAWLRRVDDRFADLEAVFTRLCSDDAAAALTMANDMVPFFARTQRFEEGASWVREAIARNPDPSIAKGRALLAAGHLGHTVVGLRRWGNVSFTHPFRGLRDRWSPRREFVRSLEGAAKVAATAVDLLEMLGAHDEAARGRVSLAWLRAALWDFEGAQEMCEAALQRGPLPPGAETLRVMLLADLALAHGNLDQALEYAEAAAEAIRTTGDAASMIMALDVLGRIAGAWGDWTTAARHYRRALDEYATPQRLPGAAVLESALGYLASQSGDTEEANRRFGTALRMAREYGLAPLEAWVRYGQALEYFVGGYFERARRYIEHGLSISERLGDIDGIVLGLAAKGTILDALGDTEMGEALHRRSLEACRGESLTVSASFAFDGMAGVHHRLGDDHTAGTLIAVADGIRERHRLPRAGIFPGSALAGTLRDRLGEKAWAAVTRAASRLTSDEAVDLALQ
jgi:tetratricopeptide (TPR) repeat protein